MFPESMNEHCSEPSSGKGHRWGWGMSAGSPVPSLRMLGEVENTGLGAQYGQ